MSIDLMIRAVQAELGVEVDGIAGQETWNAIYQKLVGIRPVVPEDTSSVSVRSEKVIGTLLPEVQPKARALIHAAAAHGIHIEATSGYRSYDEQDELYAQGRTKPGTIVTNARGGYSSHNFGTAFDVTVFEGLAPKWDGPEYATVGQLGKEIGLSWGGDWNNPDESHFALRPDWAQGLTEAEYMTGLRDRHQQGKPIYT